MPRNLSPDRSTAHYRHVYRASNQAAMIECFNQLGHFPAAVWFRLLAQFGQIGKITNYFLTGDSPVTVGLEYDD